MLVVFQSNRCLRVIFKYPLAMTNPGTITKEQSRRRETVTITILETKRLKVYMTMNNNGLVCRPCLMPDPFVLRVAMRQAYPAQHGVYRKTPGVMEGRGSVRREVKALGCGWGWVLKLSTDRHHLLLFHGV